MDPGEAPPFELKRHTGARGFVVSGTINDQVSVTRDVGHEPVEGVARDPTAPPYDVGRGAHIESRAEIENHDVLSPLESSEELLRRDPCHPEAPEEEPSTHVLQQDVADEHSQDHDTDRTPEVTDAQGHRFDGVAQHVAQPRPESCPQTDSRDLVDGESEARDAEDARQ